MNHVLWALEFFFFFFFLLLFFFFFFLEGGGRFGKKWSKKNAEIICLNEKNLSKLGAGKKKVLHFHMQKGIKIPRKNVHVRGRGRLMQLESKKQVKEGGGGGGSFFPN